MDLFSNILFLLFFFQLTTEFDPYTNETQAVGTDMRRNQAYSRFYVFWSKVIVTDLIPYFTILTLNSFIVTKIVKSIRFRARILQARNMQAEVSYDVISLCNYAWFVFIPSEYFQCFIISYLNENENFCWNQSAKKLKYSHHSLEIVTVQGPFDYRWTE